jgi:CHAD domain-containing protein/CYTH domain-containing protein
MRKRARAVAYERRAVGKPTDFDELAHRSRVRQDARSVTLPSDILRRGPEEAARRIALGYLAEARESIARLTNADDETALHDFRVSLRRLRSTLRAWDAVLPKKVTKKLRKELSKVQRATGAGRDAEVLLEWLTSEREELSVEHRPGIDWIMIDLKKRKDEAYARIRQSLRPAFEHLDARLQPRLEAMTIEVHLEKDVPADTFARAIATEARAHATLLLEAIDEIRDLFDTETMHAARIAGKRLRYLLDPLAEHATGVRAVLDELKPFQDLLGEMNDIAVLIEQLKDAMGRAASERARRLHHLAIEGDDEGLLRSTNESEDVGFVELTKRAQARREELFERVKTEWSEIGPARGRFVNAVGALAGELVAASTAGREIERKYLLSGLPPRAHEGSVSEIVQGWLPGRELRERIRRITDRNGTTYFRAVKLGKGIERIEIEEATTAEVFAALWPLTEGCRVRKRRFKLADGELVWEIDEFTDRELHLLEVELTARDTVVEVPYWLAPHVVREVTGEDRYVNLNLAR